MQLKSLLAAGCAFYALTSGVAFAQTQPVATGPEIESDAGSGEIVVTARKREESLLDVPVATTAVSGDVIEQRGFVAVRDVATLTPSLNINTDGAGRAFISIRGVGTTLIDTVQPGVGIFVDGVYQANTSYLNNPLADVERVEVLRGPQGTLYGKNTLGGAINVVTRAPSNTLTVKGFASYAGPDDAYTMSGSISGPIITDKLTARLAYTHQQQDGFIRNRLIGGDQNPLNTDTVNGTLRAELGGDARLTLNGYYTWLKGGAVPYVFVASPTDYKDDIFLNSNNLQYFRYRGASARLDLPVESIGTDITLIAAYDRRGVRTPDSDPDFTGTNTLRSVGRDDLRTQTLELRFDSELSSTFSSIIGFFYNRETRENDTVLTVLPGVANLINTTDSRTESDSYAVFGTVFWRPSDAWEVSAGLRSDRQERDAEGLQVNQFPNLLAGLPPATIVTGGKLVETELSPRVAVTRFWNDDFMTYASVARGARGGGFNPPAVPANLRTYSGDSAWTYELGAKYGSPDRRFSLAAALFYNDYSDYLGLNSILRTGASFTTIDLNTGDVESYGLELEGTFKITPQWTISGGGSLMKARLTNTDTYTATTGRTLASNRLPFQPDWNFALNSNYVVPVGKGNLAFDAGLVGKGSRIPASIQQRTPEVPGQPPLTPLKSYVLVNGSIGYRIGGVEIAAFANNLFNKKYFESYIERTTLILAGLPNSDVGIIGDKRRYGVRARFEF